MGANVMVISKEGVEAFTELAHNIQAVSTEVGHSSDELRNLFSSMQGNLGELEGSIEQMIQKSQQCSVAVQDACVGVPQKLLDFANKIQDILNSMHP